MTNTSNTSVETVPELLFEALHRLAEKLPKSLSYHSFDHTAEVLSYSRLFALADECSTRDLQLLEVAATFHDLGFLVERSRHEEVGADVASALLTHVGGFSSEETEMVHDMILDTKVRTAEGWNFKRISTRLSPYLLDADVSNFGRQAFLNKVELVRIELQALPTRAFYQGVVEMLDAHHWHSTYAKENLQSTKDINRARLLELIDKAGS